jgi:hypothetical protein
MLLLFLRRYVTYCARRRRYAQMQGAARLHRKIAARSALDAHLEWRDRTAPGASATAHLTVAR